MIRAIAKLFLLVPLIFGSGINKNMIKKTNASSDIYEIYPTVRNIEYGDSVLDFDKDVNIIFNDNVDKYTKEKAFDVISLKNVIARISNSVDNSKINVVLGIYSSTDLASSMVDEDISYIDNKIDGYYLEINSKNIIITAKDSDALYFGLSTLEFIFEQSEDSVRTLKIKDYSQSELRGFIEGYYGVPWTSKQRQELMRFGSKVKTNIYIYAPKDDVYHSTSWRSLYSEKDLKVLKEQVETGRITKTRLAWAIHPFMNRPLTASTYDTDLQIIKNKFDQIYNAGVRQFVLSADDVPLSDTATDATLHRRLANDLSAFLKSKGDCYNLVYVPTAYTAAYEETEVYLTNFVNGLDESVSIMWTGEYVCSMMNRMKFDVFKEYTNNKKPFVWMNWSVNDFAVNNLHLGKGEVYNVKYDNDDEVEFSGIVSNPMQFAEASKLAVWATADYAWNTKDFDMDKSYEDSFKYIEAKESVAFKKIAEHLIVSGKFNDVYFEESTSLKPYVSAFKEAYESGNYINEMNDLNDYFDDLIATVDQFIDNAENRRLVDEIELWAITLKWKSKVIEQYLYLIKNINSLSDEELLVEYNKLNDYITQSDAQTSPVLISGEFAIVQKQTRVGITVIPPFISYLDDLIMDDIYLRLGYSTGVKYKGFDSIYKGTLDNIVDGDESTYCWFGSHPTSDAYVRVDLGEAKTINDIYVRYGTENENDRMYAYVQVSNDAKTWETVGSTSAMANSIDLRSNPVEARFVRLLNNGTETWVSIKEIQINKIPADQYFVTYDGIDIYDGTIDNLFDGDDSSYCWFARQDGKAASITLDLRSVKHVDNFVFKMAQRGDSDYDYLTNYSVYVSADGINYTKVGDDHYSTKSIDISINQDVRYIKVASNEVLSYWLYVNTMDVNI